MDDLIKEIDSVYVLRELNELLEIIELHKNSNTTLAKALKDAARVISRGLPQRWQWIHVSERFPGKEGKYLIAFEDGDVDIADFAHDLSETDCDAFSEDIGHRPGFYRYDDGWGYYEMPDVAAWMPRPEFP